LYLYGSDRASILQSINRGRRGIMLAFDGKLRTLPKNNCDDYGARGLIV
jgi:hypothetical protein